MKIVIVSSENPVKVHATRQGFEQMFPDEAFEVRGVKGISGVSDQPMSSDETYRGAYNRARAVQGQYASADFYVGIEGGVEKDEKGVAAFSWIVIMEKDAVLGRARTGAFYLPPKITELIDRGYDLAEADSIVFGRENAHQKDGSIGALTGGVMNRTGHYAEAIVLALIPFKNKELYR